MIVLGIDPGSLRTGWGVVEQRGGALLAVAEGVLRPRADWPLQRRLAHLHEEAARLLQSYAPDLVAIESVFHGANTRALVTLGQARGAILAAAGRHGAVLVELSPAEVKKAVTGSGRSTKAQVAQMLGVLLGPKFRARQSRAPLAADATDALGVALAALHRAAARRAGDLSAAALPALEPFGRRLSTRASRRAQLRRLAGL